MATTSERLRTLEELVIGLGGQVQRLTIAVQRLELAAPRPPLQLRESSDHLRKHIELLVGLATREEGTTLLEVTMLGVIEELADQVQTLNEHAGVSPEPPERGLGSI